MTAPAADWPTWLQLASIILASVRLAVLITDDEITAPVRGRYIDWAVQRNNSRWRDRNPDLDFVAVPPTPLTVRLLDCAGWCVGWWVALAATAAWFVSPGWATTILLPAAVAGAVGVITPSPADDDEDE